MQSAIPLACFLSMIRPPGIQFENSLLQIAPVEKAKCPYVKDHNDIEFRLYTRHNPTVYQELYIEDDDKLFASNLDYHAPTVIYFHAFMENPDDGSAAMVREAYVLRGDTNIIMVDASRLEAGPWYFTAAENTWYIGKFAAQFVDYLVTRGLNLNNTHFVGHSLGAQAAGVAGSALKTGRVARITGLDPALPLFHGLPLEQRLDKSDADFVDVIHTDSGIFGVNKPVGHADFYPNGGISPQPGCELEVVIPQHMLLNKCDANAQPRGYYTFHLSPNRITKNSLILEKRLQKFFTRIQNFNSNAKEMKKEMMKVDKKGQMLLKIEPKDNLEAKKLDPQTVIGKRFLDPQESRKFDPQERRKLVTCENMEKELLDPQESIKTRTLGHQESIETRTLDAQESNGTTLIHTEKNNEATLLDPKGSLKPSVGNPQKSPEIHVYTQDSIETRQSYSQESVTPRTLDYTESIKTEQHQQENLKTRILVTQENQYSNEDQIMVESVKKYHVLNSEFVAKDDNNFGTMKPITTKNKNEKIVEHQIESQDKMANPDIGVQLATILDLEPFRLDLDRYLIPPRVEKKHRKFQTKEGVMKPAEEVKIGQMPFYLNQDIFESLINNLKTQNKLKNNQENYRTVEESNFSQGDSDFDSKSHKVIQISFDSEEPKQTNSDTQKQIQVDSGYLEKTKIHSEPQQAQIDAALQTQSDPNNQEQTQVDPGYQKDRQIEPESQKHHADLDYQQQSQIHFLSQKENKSDAASRTQSDPNSQKQSQVESGYEKERSQIEPESQAASDYQEQSQIHSESQKQTQIDAASRTQRDPNSEKQSQVESGYEKESQIEPEQNQADSNTQKHHTDSDLQEQTKSNSKNKKNHVVKRQKRFLNPFKRSEAEQQDNFLFKLLDFVFKHRKSIPVYSVMREINTLVKSAHGELNHISKERNNYIGAPPPTLIPITYSLELGNENKVTAFVKKLLGLAPKGDRLTINGHGK